ncbi:response regulator transcription factor [Aquibacillus salsiterrae]|uniref:Response regulator n=1 Tax=Aquibacillus salsiterrae TaxID=2950439 RepID=A0A9X3WGJ2_9BACI|nr:response regulator [Aquibacillus salsiterrae]MDC3418233.1 response regulator [Aquibacillus salsiterrae]
MRKWKVLIADDEFIIRDGIRSSIDWEKNGMEVVGEAEDGEEAVELAVEHQIDVLLIDLNMPIVDGINAMKQLKEKLPHCKMVVISGYDDFSNAQEAIRLQVVDYLLKPVNPEKLNQLIEDLKGKLEDEMNHQNYLEQATKQINKNHSQLKTRFFQDWIDGKLKQEEIEAQLQFLKLPQVVPVQHLAIKWPDYHLNQTMIQEHQRQSFLYAIENIIEEMLESNQIAIFRDRSYLLNVFLWDSISVEQVAQIGAAIRTYLNINVYSHLETMENIKLTDIYRVYERSKLEVEKQSQVSPIVKGVQQYLNENYHDSTMNLAKVADEFHVTKEYLSRIVKQELGISYVSLLSEIRINKAIDLLKTTDMTIREIAEKVGYDSQHYFSTAFKKVVGLSPKQFK